ncbi:hypothetical protein EK21DRAFT_114034 [Setomelanomma holmii]|uniref:NAD-dependent epimerase/dehydratase domain-containing protein n=1 Tax=Setomelanomma holmii TaxID=210430 RepID=A0A9P4LL35_9PLEO|nr:hypothetical protein EK21DRAFT_114034 [Setomelanomma holmii]
MAKTRVILTGADGLIGSHVLAQLLSSSSVSVRAVVGSREAAAVLQQRYQQGIAASFDVSLLPGQDLSVPGVFDGVLCGTAEPFTAVVHTLVSSSSDRADCLARFINLEIDIILSLLGSVQETARSVTRVVIVTSLTPFARWLVGPDNGRGSARLLDGQASATTTDTTYVLATSQASDNIVYDSVTGWVRKSGGRFAITYVTVPEVYGPTIFPLETSTDLSVANRRIWDICSNEPPERTEMSPYGVDHFLDVRDLATSTIRALFVPQAANKRFVISAGIMPPGSKIAEYIVGQFPRLAGRIRIDGIPHRHNQLDDPTLDSFDMYLLASILGITYLRSPEVTILDTTRQILDLQQRKTWKNVIES